MRKSCAARTYEQKTDFINKAKKASFQRENEPSNFVPSGHFFRTIMTNSPKGLQTERKIKSALISVFYKDNLEPVIRRLHELGVVMYSTGGTQTFIEQLGIPVVAVESLT